MMKDDLSGKHGRLQDVKMFFVNKDNPKQPKSLSDVVMGVMHIDRGRSNALALAEDSGGVNLGQCFCVELQAINIPKLVHYWSCAGNPLKTFQVCASPTDIL